MWNFCKGVGAVGIICGGIGLAIWGLVTGIVALEHDIIDYKAQVNIETYGTKFDGYVRVCTSNGVPASVCVLAWPNGARK